MKIALVHDFLVQDGGAERVLKCLSEMYPEAPIYVWFYDPEKVDPYFKTKDVRTSFIQKLPFVKTHYQWYLPLLPAATDSFDFSGYDVVISSSSSFIKGIITPPKTLHICYCHTPPRYLWTDTHEYVRNLRKTSIIKKFLPFYLTKLRMYDALSAQRVDVFVSNSENVARRIKNYYRRDSTVIPPPVEVHEDFMVARQGNYFLSGGRLMAYKRFDLIIKAFNMLRLPLIVFGTGRDERELRRMARDNIVFVGRVDDAKRNQLFAECLAFINPQEEDFGITPVEAMAHGRPVIAFRSGGNLETVDEHVTGEFFDYQTWEHLAETILRFRRERFNSEIIRQHAKNFSVEQFQVRMRKFVLDEWKKYHMNSISTHSGTRCTD